MILEFLSQENFEKTEIFANQVKFPAIFLYTTSTRRAREERQAKRFVNVFSPSSIQILGLKLRAKKPSAA